MTVYRKNSSSFILTGFYVLGKKHKASWKDGPKYNIKSEREEPVYYIQLKPITVLT